MAITTQDSRIIIKRSSITGQVPTIAPSNDHTDGSWNPLNIYKSEIFINLADSRAWFRSNTSIIELATINGPSDAFINGGNTYGSNAIFGLTDNYKVDFKANNNIIFSLEDKGLVIKYAKELYFSDSGTEAVTIAAPAVIGTSYNLTLPTAQGAANTFLKNDGTGILSWAAAGGGGGGLLNGTTSGTDTYTATIAGVAAYADGDAYLIRFTNGNTTIATLNINSLGAINIYRNNDGPLIGGDIQAGGEMLCVYNSTLGIFQAIGTSPNSIIAYVTNDDSVSITKGMPVYAFSGTGDRMTVKRADNTTDATSAQTMGLVMSTSIASGQKGFIITQGLLDNLSTLPTATFADGDAIYLGATAGAITNVKPHAPNHLVYLGVCTTASAGSSGRMYVKVQNGYELDEIHNVQAQSPTNKDTLYYDSADSQWKTAQIATILGYNPSITNLFSYYNFI